jgi:hypothetical protein
MLAVVFQLLHVCASPMPDTCRSMGGSKSQSAKVVASSASCLHHMHAVK